MLDFPIAKILAQLAGLKQKCGVAWPSFRLSIVQVNRGDDGTASFHPCTNFRKQIALQIVEDANQIISLGLNPELAKLQVGNERIDSDAGFTGALSQNLNCYSRRINRCHVPAVLGKEDCVTSRAARKVKHASRREMFDRTKKQRRRFFGRVLASAITLVPIRHDELLQRGLELKPLGSHLRRCPAGASTPPVFRWRPKT